MNQGEKQLVKRGMFIVFEGLDRSGKSTQAKKAADYLQTTLGVQCKTLSFPSKFLLVLTRNKDRESVSGKILNEYLMNKEVKISDEAIHLLFAMNRWEMKDQFIKDLEAGVTLICDRYAFSGVAYSAAKVQTFST